MLADLLWDDRTQRQAMANLRVVLSSLRKEVGSFATITRHEAGVNPEAPVWVDAVELEAAAERERLHRLVTGTLNDLADFELASGLYQAGQAHAGRLLELDPLHEGAHRQSITLLALSDRRGEALAQYERCRRLLDEEMGVLPSPETQELHQLLLRGEQPPVPEIGELLRARSPRTVGPSPYHGLSAFREEDAPFFYGREAFVERLYRSVQRKPLVTVVVGSSGSGKSSALHAGLLPRLREVGGWAVAGFRPGSHPFQSLAAALLPMLEPEFNETERLAESPHLAALLFEGDGALERALERVLEKQPRQGRLLIWVDQFEELYTLCRDPDGQRRFLDAILNAVESAGVHRRPTFVFLLTMRADFMGQALSHRPFADALQDASLLLGPMTREELQASIELPAEKQGAAFEEGLVERILDDLGHEPGNLPLLEFALTLLWERHEQGWLTHAGYESIGRVEGALASYAEEVCAGLSAGEQEGTRRALIQLVRPGEGTEDTRRVATREEVGEERWQLIRHLADKRLVVTGRDAAGQEVAEVVHEALIQRWGRFREWMESDRAFRTWQERTRNNLRQWQESDQDVGALLNAAPLSIAQQWLAEREEDLSRPEVEYIQESQTHQERRQAERDRRRRRTVMALVAGLIITIALAALAYYQRRNSQRQAAFLLAGQAESELAVGYHDRAVLLALEALEQFPYTSQAEHALGQAVIYNRALQQYTGHSSAATSVAWSPDGAELVTAGMDGTARVWDAQSGEERLLLEGHEGRVTLALWSPDSELLATAGDDGTVQIWQAGDGRQLRQLEPDTESVWSLAWSPDASRLVSGHDDGRLAIWDVATGDLLATLAGHHGLISDLAWSPVDDRLASSDNSGFARIWNATPTTAWRTFPAHYAQGLDWSNDGRFLAVAGGDIIGDAEPPSFFIWDRVADQIVVEGLAGELNYDSGTLLFFSPDDQAILFQGTPGFPDFSGFQSVYALDPWSGEFLRTFTADEGNMIWSFNWSPDGSQVATGTHDNPEIWIWDYERGNVIQKLRHVRAEAAFQDVTWSPDGTKLAAALADPGLAPVWDARNWELLYTVDGHEPPTEVWSVEWSPDGHYLATSGLGPPTSVWRVWQSREELTEYARECCVFRELTSAERQQFGLSGQ